MYLKEKYENVTLQTDLTMIWMFCHSLTRAKDHWINSMGGSVSEFLRENNDSDSCDRYGRILFRNIREIRVKTK